MTRSRASQPSSTFRLLVRQPLLLLFVLGCFVSVVASGRLTARLIVDGALSFAFIPALEVLALGAVVLSSGLPRPGRSFPELVDSFCEGNRPWLVWLVSVMIVPSLVPPRSIGPWFVPVLSTALIPAAISVWIDARFFRQSVGQRPDVARRSVFWHRAISWTLAGAYFLGIALWSDTLPGLARQVGL